METTFLVNLSSNERKRVFATLNKIQRNAYQKKWKCLIPNCNSDAIYSHVLQKNGILNTVSKNSHVYQLVFTPTIDEKRGGKAIFKLIGINEALSYPIFCNKHDTETFKEIEGAFLSMNDYKVQLLFTYRAICLELHKKRVGVEYFSRVLQSVTLDLLIEKNNYVYTKQSYNLGLQDCFFYKNQIEDELREANNNFFFKVLKYPLIKVSASAIFTPLDENEHGDGINPFKYVFINIVPFQNSLFIILGYHKMFSNSWIINYIDSWCDLDILSFGKKISELFASRIETFCISPEIMNSMKSEKKNSFLTYWNRNLYNFYETQSFDVNIFS